MKKSLAVLVFLSGLVILWISVRPVDIEEDCNSIELDNLCQELRCRIGGLSEEYEGPSTGHIKAFIEISQASESELREYAYLLRYTIRNSVIYSLRYEDFEYAEQYFRSELTSVKVENSSAKEVSESFLHSMMEKANACIGFDFFIDLEYSEHDADTIIMSYKDVDYLTNLH